MSLCQYRLGQDGAALPEFLAGDSLWTMGYFPSLDVRSVKGAFIIQADLPGFKKEELTISLDDGLLTIEGERKLANEGENQEFYRRERFEGRFVRHINLGQHIDQQNINAQLNDGVLTITVPHLIKETKSIIQIKS